MKAVLLFVGLSAPSVLTAQVNPPAFSPLPRQAVPWG